MFDIYIKDFNQDGRLITDETLVQTIPASKPGDLKLTTPLVKTDLGNAETFSFGIEGGTKFYDAFNQMKTFMRVVYDGDTIFYGRILTIDNGFFGTRTFRCEGPLAFLNDSSIEGVKEESRIQKTINDYFQELIDSHNAQVSDYRRSFTLGEIPGKYTNAVSEDQQVVKNSDVEAKKRKYGSDSWSDTKGLIEDLRSHYGGYLRVRCPGYKSGNKYVDQGHIIDWMNHYFTTREISQSVEVGKNVIDISSSTEVDNIFTVVIPIGNTKATSSETVDGEKKSTGPKHFYVEGKEVTVPSICAKYGSALNSGYHTYEDYELALDRYGRIIKTVVFDDAENADQLLEKCQEWIKNNYQGEVTKFTIKAVDMHQIGDKTVSKIRVGDQVRLIYPVVNEDGTVNKRSIVRTCLSVSYDLYNPENNSYTFGIPANILTKSYGVLKQAGDKDTATKPKNTSSSGSSKTQDWLSQVTQWLADHKIGYKHYIVGTGSGSSSVKQGNVDERAVFPYSKTYKSYEKGPYGNRNDYFYNTEYTGGIGRFTLWQFTPVGNGEQFDQAELDKILADIDAAMPGTSYEDTQARNQAKKYAEQSYRNSRNHTEYTGKLITLNGVLSHEDIVLCNIIGWVREEYQIDLSNFNNIKMPDITVTDENGVTSTYGATDAGTIVTKEFFKADFDGTGIPGYHIINRVDNDGNVDRLVSIKDVNGEWHYYVLDKEGNVVETSVRNLQWIATDSETFRGSMVQEGYAGPDGQLHVYKFGQEIGKYYGGELVTAYVDGDKVVIGNTRTTQQVTMALENISNVCGDFTYSQDPDTGEVKLVIKEGSAIYQKKDGIDVGYYHDGNLTGGIMVTKINNQGETITRIVGDKIVIGQRRDGSISKDITIMATDSSTIGLFNVDANGNAVMEAGTKIYRTKDGVTAAYGIWDSSGQEIEGGLVAEKINGQTTTYIRGDRIVVGNAQTNKSIMDALKTAGVITSDTLEPQALVVKSIYTEKISGIEGDIQTIKSDYVKTDLLASKIAVIPKLSVRDITGYETLGSASTAKFGEYYGDHFYIQYSTGPQTTDKVDLKRGAHNASITLSGNTYTLHLYDSVGTEITAREEDVRTFSRATTLNGEWSGGVYTVTASPQGNTQSTTLHSIVVDEELDPAGTMVRAYMKVHYATGNPQSPSEDTGMTRKLITLSGTKVYNKGKEDGWDLARSFVSAPSESTANAYFDFGVPSVTYNKSSSYRYTVSVDDNYAYIKNASNKNVARVSHTKKKDGWDLARTFVSAPAESTSSASFTVGIPASTYNQSSSYTYTVYVSGGYAYVKNAANKNVARVSAPEPTPSTPTFQTRSPSSGYWTTSSIQVASTTSGGSTGSYATVSMSIDNAVPIYGAGNQPCLVSTYNNNVIAIYSLQTFYKNSYDAGSTAGWQAYYDKSSWWQKPEGSNGWVCKIPNRAGTGSEQWFKFSTSVSSGTAWWTSTTSEDTARTAGALAMGCAKTDITIIYAKSSGATADTWAFFKVGSSPYMIGF